MEAKKFVRWFIVLDVCLIILAAIVLVLYPSLFPAKKKATHTKNENVRNEEQEQEGSVELNGLELTLSAPKRSYPKSDEVKVSLTLKNTSDTPRELNFASGRQFDVWVQNTAGEEIWRWSHNKAFIQIVQQSLKLEPGQEKTYKASWPQTSNEGKQVEAGTYSILGKIETEGLDKVPQVEIEIRD